MACKIFENSNNLEFSNAILSVPLFAIYLYSVVDCSISPMRVVYSLPIQNRAFGIQCFSSSFKTVQVYFPCTSKLCMGPPQVSSAIGCQGIELREASMSIRQTVFA